MSTYTPQNALDLAQVFTHGTPFSSQIGATMCDIVNSMMWTFYPWAWSLSNLTAITCTDGVQDYTPTDTNILRPVRLQLKRTDITPNETRELALLANLSPELTRKGGLETNTAAGWYAANNFIRLMYAASVGTGQTLQIVGIYQKQPTAISKDTLQNVLPFPDYYFNVFVEGLKWKMYQLSDDARAGTSSYSKNGSMMRQYSGQLGTFMDQLLQMARTEDLASGDEFIWPEDPIGVGRSYWPGLYGL